MKHIFRVLMALIVAFVLLLGFEQINLEEAILEAREAETDGEILEILHNHGFRVGINEKITAEEKIKALFR